MRFHLNSRHFARIVADAQIKLVLLVNNLIEPNGGEIRPVSDRKNSLQIIQGAKRNRIAARILRSGWHRCAGQEKSCADDLSGGDRSARTDERIRPG